MTFPRVLQVLAALTLAACTTKSANPTAAGAGLPNAAEGKYMKESGELKQDVKIKVQAPIKRTAANPSR